MSVKHPDATDIVVGKKIRALRLQREMSQSALAEKLGVTFQQVQKYEKGVNRVGAGRLLAIAKILGTDVTAIFDGAEVAARKHTAGTDDPLIELGLRRDGLQLASHFNAITSGETRAAIVGIVALLAQQETKKS